MIIDVRIVSSLLLLCWSYDCFCNSETQNASGKFKNYSAEAMDFLRKFDDQATTILSAKAEASWRYETDLTEENRENSVFIGTRAEGFLQRASGNASQIKEVELSSDMARQIRIIRRSTSPKSLKDVKLIDDLISNMTRIYSTGKPCKHNAATNQTRCYELDPDLYMLMAKSRDYNELLWAWKSWRDAVGPQMRPLYQKLVGLLNSGAREHGWGDYGNFQRSEYEMGNDFQSAIKKLWIDVRPLYEELHAYVRYKLRDRYPNVSANGSIQAHLLGNMWAQDWSEIFDLVMPYPKAPSLDVTPNLIKQQYSPKKMFKLTQSFFVSMGLEPMPHSFWNKSVFIKPNDKKMVCHASAWDFSKGDVR